MLQCYNRGCGQTYDPANNTEESCRHHPGQPFFHDAYKGWSCCNKKSVDFTEFLSIKGCTLSEHSNVKPPEPEKPAKEETADLSQEVIEVRAPIPVAMKRPPVDMPMTRLQPTVAAAHKAAVDARKAKASEPKTVTADLALLAGGEVPVGTACKNSGCTYSYVDAMSNSLECDHHPGVPIFHEGMKYWSCCQKKTSDFAAFMAQRGCITGRHKWFKENDDKKAMQCRHDWFQTGSNVIVSIYGKLYDYAVSIVEVNPVRLHVSLVFLEPENARFEMDLELRGIILPAKTTVQMYGTKVEITMPKAEVGSWPLLDFPRAHMPAARQSGDALDDDAAQETPADPDDVDLDDIETVNTGLKLTELASKKHDLD